MNITEGLLEITRFKCLVKRRDYLSFESQKKIEEKVDEQKVRGKSHTNETRIAKIHRNQNRTCSVEVISGRSNIFEFKIKMNIFDIERRSKRAMMQALKAEDGQILKCGNKSNVRKRFVLRFCEKFETSLVHGV